VAPADSGSRSNGVLYGQENETPHLMRVNLIIVMQMNQTVMDLARMYDGIAARMTAHMAAISKSFNNSGEQGASNERILARFLTDFLPRRYAVGRGKIIAPSKEVSAQIDIIIYDAFNCPAIYAEEGFLVVGLDSVFGTVEVKTTLTHARFKDANRNAGFLRPGDDESGQRQANANEVPLAACFAFSSEVSIPSLWNVARELKDKGELFIDLVCVLNDGVIVDSSNCGFVPIELGPRSLPFFLACLVDGMGEISPRKFHLFDYFR